jgi:hypothetical protein
MNAPRDPSALVDDERDLLCGLVPVAGIDAAKLAATRAVFEPHCGPGGAHCVRPMHVRLLCRAPRVPVTVSLPARSPAP